MKRRRRRRRKKRKAEHRSKSSHFKSILCEVRRQQFPH
jgi:hypothetical protein